MEHTFMTIHNLTPDANILFASDSITDILGYRPTEVQDKSCFDYFHPDEVPFARHVHNRGVLLDKAAVLHYARIRSRDGRWVSCECCFTVVHDVLVACISIYRRNEKSNRRAIDAPQIRRIFSCSPRDPRYHMLEHLSPKFKMPAMEREPRAALILNRFTRSLGVMFATDAVASILGLGPEHVQDKSFYECIQESCLEGAVKCMESAKANDSIAYLRFWFRDPRRPEDLEQDHVDEDESLEDEEEGLKDRGDTAIKQEDEVSDQMCWTRPREEAYDDSNLSAEHSGGVPLMEQPDFGNILAQAGPIMSVQEDTVMGDGGVFTSDSSASTSQRASIAPRGSRHSTSANPTPSTPSSTSTGADRRQQFTRNRTPPYPVPSVELEAVVSCTSDGLVVVLRRARPQIPMLYRRILSSAHGGDGLFAAPWGQRPIQPQSTLDALHTFRSPLLPRFMPLTDNIKSVGGPPADQLMKSIRDVGVFAWALVGINGTLAAHSHGSPMGEAQPPDGLPVWDPQAGYTKYQGPENQAAARWAGFGDLGMPTYTAPQVVRPSGIDLGQPQSWDARMGPNLELGVLRAAQIDMADRPDTQHRAYSRAPGLSEPAQTGWPETAGADSGAWYESPSPPGDAVNAYATRWSGDIWRLG